MYLSNWFQLFQEISADTFGNIDMREGAAQVELSVLPSLGVL